MLDGNRGSAQLPWPYRKKGMPKTLILFGDLAKAVRRESNQAVAFWWGVAPQTVTVWRKALGVPPTTVGTSKLRSAHFHEHWARRAQKKAVAKARDPERRAKIAAARRGKPRPPQVIEAMRKANLGKRHSAESRQKMSVAHKRRGTRPPAAGRAWTPEEDAMIGNLPANEVARLTARSVVAVRIRRRKLGLPDGRTREARQKRA
jgi:hypothetical protein